MDGPDVPGPDEWDAWSPKQTADLLRGCNIGWAVAGGWALDLARGSQSRGHKDTEIVVGEAALPVLRAHLRDYQFFAAAEGQLTQLAELPQLREVSRQHWVLDRAVRKWRLDVMMEPGDEHWWIYRRDTRIAAPRAQVVAIAGGNIPYLRPHVVLLFKAHQPRPIDEDDFDLAVDLLAGSERQWLRAALQLTSSGHHWIKRLAE